MTSTLPRSSSRVSISGTIALLLLALPITAQSTWLDVSPLKGPGARNSHAMAYDPSRGVVVLFGNSAETWEWDGHLWTQKKPLSSPSARRRAAMAYDPKTKKILLFGGVDSSKQRFADTWLWDGVAWKRLSPKQSPPAREEHAMATDTNRAVVVMFGGSDGQRAYADTWEWNGTDWTGRSSGSGSSDPAARVAHALAYDAERQQTVMAGGSRVGGSSNETWVWNGTVWAQRFGGNFIASLIGPAMAYDSTRKRVVAYGGRGSQSSVDDTVREWDGQRWVTLSPKNFPKARYYHAMAYDSRRRRLVMFGGTNTTGNLGDTWELVHDCFCVGEGHEGGGLPITCVSPPVLGSNFRVAFSKGQGTSALLFIGPAPVTSVWMKLAPPLVCSPASLHAQIIVTFPVAGTPAVITFRVPRAPKLAGLRVTLQGASPQQTGCYLATDAIEVTFRHQ